MSQKKKKENLQEELLEAQAAIEKFQKEQLEYEKVQKHLEATLENLRVHQEELRTQNEHLQELQEEIRESHHKYFDLFESAPIGYFTLDCQGIILETNITGSEMLGFDRRHLKNTRLSLYVSAPYRQQFSSHLLKVFTDGIRDSIEVDIQCPGIGKMCALLESVPMFSRDRNVKTCRTAMLDVTERKRLEDQLHQGQKMESLGVLAGGIAHDFNNLLAAISSHAGLALRAVPDENPAMNHIEQIHKAALSGGELANQMLIYSGRETLSRNIRNLTDLVKEIGHLLEVTIPKGAELKFDLDPSHTWINCDATQIRQIILNLVTNASESLTKGIGLITLKTGIMDVDPEYFAQCYFASKVLDNQMIFLEVKDTGSGMPPETLNKIFDPFFTTKSLGRGLGLSALIGVVRAHRGAIHVSSEVACGTAFRVMFPILSEPPVFFEKSVGRKSQVDGKEHGLFLVVDDEEQICRTAEMYLEQMGFSVLTARNGYEALEVVKSYSAELKGILLDLTMPGLSGDQVFKKIQQIAPHIPVILSSGYTEEDVVHRFSKAHVRAFIQKPYALENLLEKVLGALYG